MFVLSSDLTQASILNVWLRTRMEKGWNFLGLYGDPVAANRRFSWDLIRRVMASHPGPWLVGGDLNELSENHELSHGRMREPHLLESFVACSRIENSRILASLGLNSRGDVTRSRIALKKDLIDTLLHRIGEPCI